jgi:hypothetical protein
LSDEDFNLVLFVPVEGLEVGGLNPLTVDAEEFVSFFNSPAGDFGVKAFPTSDEGGKEIEAFRFSKLRLDSFDDVGGILADGGFAGVGIVLDSEFGVEESEELIEFGDSCDGGLSAATCGSLFDGDGGGETRNRVDVRFFKLFDELTGVCV